MAEKKISELVSLTGAQSATGDLLPIVDISAVETKKITRDEFFKNIPALAVNGNITVGGTVDGRDVAADGTKLDGIEAGADVTDTANVTAAGALMDSELTNITAVKALNQGVATTDSPTFANLTTSGYLRGPANFTIDPAAHGDDTGTLIIAGNLQVDGTTTTINSQTLTVADKNIVMAEGAADAAAADGGGIIVDGANATFTYAATGDKWVANKSVEATVLGTVSSISNHDTDDLAEGSTNLYYTTARFDTAFSGKTTTNLAEGTNLYYTDARFDSRLATKTTSDLTEGSNLYYTATRANAAIDARVTQTFVNNLNIDAATLGGDSKTTILATAQADALALAIALG